MSENSALKTLTVPLDYLCKRDDLDIVIVGSGPSGVACAEYVYNVFPEATTAILERGKILTLTHINNVFPDVDPRAQFFKVHGSHPWKGALENGAMTMFALGGRGIVAGGHLRRFDDNDYYLWPDGQWHLTPSELAPFFTVAEIVRHVSPGECESPAQTWVMGELDRFKPHAPPWGVDVRATGTKRGLDSSVQRLCELIHRDCFECDVARGRRLLVATDSLVTKLSHVGGQVLGVECVSPTGGVTAVRAKVVVLAASPVASAELVLRSDLSLGEVAPVVGRYFAEHLLCRAQIPVPYASLAGGVNVVVPPPSASLHERYQIDIKTVTGAGGQTLLRISGFAAMDPRWQNRVELIGGGVQAFLEPSARDRHRVLCMRARMAEVAERLGAPPDSAISEPALGWSNHEIGTLRMGLKGAGSVTNFRGQIHGVGNLFVADASVFPCVGVANPMLTTTALAYRLADYLGSGVLRLDRRAVEPWTICGPRPNAASASD